MIAAPAHWAHEPVRGCAVCTFGRDAAGCATRAGGKDAAICICPSVTGRNVPKPEPADWPLGHGVPVRNARANTGASGPEAYHLTFAGLR